MSNKIDTHYLDIGYGMAKDLAVSGRIAPDPMVMATFARQIATELAADFKDVNAAA
jgi:hypothetical protein